MSLRNLQIKEEYRSDRDDLIADFYVLCLEQSTQYDRAVGFFSSSSLAAIAPGLRSLIQVGGRMRLVASLLLSAEDVKAIAQGLEDRDAAIARVLVQELEQEFDQVVGDRLACLAWMLAQGVLDIRLAVPKDLQRQGIYHEKLGIFRDEEGNCLAFTGSANETSSALMGNFECVDVFPSWGKGVQERTARKVKNFEDLWRNGTANVEVMAFPEAARRSLLKFKPRQFQKHEPRVASPQPSYTTHPDFTEIDINIEAGFPSNTPRLPEGLVLRDYQELALQNWFDNQGCGTLKMATGSGKTITALAIATQAFQNLHLKALIVVCPYRHLVSQWARECEKFGLQPILAFESTRKWQGKMVSELYHLRAGSQTFLTVITTNTTFMSQGFQSQIGYFPEQTLLVGDEAHNFGSLKLVQSLPESIPYRLALSATPERYFDETGTEDIYRYFGNVLDPEFTLRDAIAKGALVHYLYYPILVSLTEEEAERYTQLAKKISRLIGMHGIDEENTALTPLLLERSRIIGSAANKLTALRELMRDRLDTTHTLFYCGDGTVEDEISMDSQRQLDVVARILGRDLGYRVNTYTAQTPLDTRDDLHRLFEAGELQGLVAIRCLDEGVDIPATQTAVILASSNNPRQFIQRRGRILRRHPNKNRATLYDMIVVPPTLERETFEIDRQLLRRELTRFVEFADLADNSGEARLKLLALQQQYELLDL